jgi:excisionase family DNA binding protein
MPHLKPSLAENARYGTTHDVARKYRISRSRQYELLSDGLIKAKKLGSRTLIDLESVDAYLSSLPDYEATAA